MHSWFSRLGCPAGATLILVTASGPSHVAAWSSNGNTWPRVVVATCGTGRSVQLALQGASDAWPRVHLSNALGRAAVLSSLEGASNWLRDVRCQGIFSEFRDLDEGPLVDRLTGLGVGGSAFLRMLFFHEGTDTRQCQSGRIEAFTSAGSRVIFICGREFERLWQANNLRARAIVIHEALHSLGLGENPPSSQEITRSVLTACDR